MNYLDYFGTFTEMGAELPSGEAAAMNTFTFEYLTTLGLAAIVIFVGRYLVFRFDFLRKVSIPAPVVSGLLFALLIALITLISGVSFDFDMDIMRDLSQNIFFLTVGYGFSISLVKSGGAKLITRIIFCAVLLITLQNIVGLTVGYFLGLDPLLTLQSSSASMTGGVGTGSAFGPIFEEMGAENATSIGVAAGTVGNIMGALVGGPLAAVLISRHNLKSDPNDVPEVQAEGKEPSLRSNRMIYAFGLVLLIGALGMPIYGLLDSIPYVTMPKFIGCMLAGAVVRNILEAFDVPLLLPEINTLQNMFLELYLALVLMSINILDVAPVVGEMSVILFAQLLLAVLFTYNVSFKLYGKDYPAAVMAAGETGWALGSGSNGIATEDAVIKEHGYSKTAWIIYPSMAIIVADMYNPILISILSSLVA